MPATNTKEAKKEYWWFELKCKKCGTIERYIFGEPSEMVRQMIGKQESPPADPCDKCKCITIQELVAYSFATKTIKW